MRARTWPEIFALLLFSGLLRTPQVFGDGRTVNPASYRSPSGEFVCEVDPSDLYGRGEASYRVLHKGLLVWAGKKPFTLCGVGITDDGLVAGYAYTHGLEGFPENPPKDNMGELVVAIMDSKGNLRLKETVHRERSRFEHQPPDPLVSGIIVDPSNNRFIVRVSDADVNRGRESWWTYNLALGKADGKFDLDADDGEKTSLVRAVVLPGTPLTLLHYWRPRWPSRNLDARFALIDLSLKEVWSVTWRRDYNIPGNENAEDRLQDRIFEEGAILDASVGNQFSLYSAKESQRVTFSVQPPKANSTKWAIKEVARNKVEDVKPETRQPVWLSREPLKLLGTFTFENARTKESELFRDIVAFGFDDRDRIGVVRRKIDKTFHFAVLENDGRLIRDSRLTNIIKTEETWEPKLAWIEGERWIVTVSELGVGGKAAAWWLNAVSGEIKAVSNFTCPCIERLAGSGDGGFVALTLNRRRYTMDDELIGFDKTGKARWRVKEDYSYDSTLFGPKDIAVNSRGRITVLDSHRVQFFNADGTYARMLELEKTWGRKPNYPTGISMANDETILIHDFHGSPPFVRMTGDGKVLSQFELTHQDGRVISGRAKISPSGRIWASDGTSLVRVTDQGKADLVLGPPPKNETLGRVAATFVTQRGNLYAVDERTGAVHVFDDSGRRLRVCSPEISDFTETLILPNLAVRESGEFFLNGERDFPDPARYVRFDAEGKRVGVKRLGLDVVREQWYPLPAGDRTLVLGYHDAFIVDSEGKVVRKIQRRADGKWLEEVDRASVAPDGSFAILTREDNRDKRVFLVSIYSSDGEPIRTIRLPDARWSICFAFTGKYLITCTESEIWIFKESGAPLRSFRYPLEHLNEHWWTCFSAHDGRELWMVCAGLKKVCRFELPK